MKNKILWIITFLPLLITIAVYPFMEDKVPMHYDIDGNIDRWGSKSELFIFPVAIIFITMFWKLLIIFYEKKQKKSSDEKVIKEASSNAKVLLYVALSQAAMFAIMHCFSLYSTYKESRGNYTEAYIDIGNISCLCIGIILIIAGNVMPKTRINGMVGLRTSWSMENDMTWSVSNRYSGILVVVSGILIIAISCMMKGIGLIAATLSVVIGMAVICSIISYIVYKKYK